MTAQKRTADKKIDYCLKKIAKTRLTALDFLPHTDLAEKLIELDLSGSPPGTDQKATANLMELANALSRVETQNLKVVVFGGGTGLSNVVGGDSRNPGWFRTPFGGLKNIFPHVRSIVCITDDGGSTGELLKDLPLIALGDIRHVLLSSIQKQILFKQYDLGEAEAQKTAKVLHSLFNYRFDERPPSAESLFASMNEDLADLPEAMGVILQRLVSLLFADARFANLLDRPHCLGNLLLAASIYLQIDNMQESLAESDSSSDTPGGDENTKAEADVIHLAVIKGLNFLARLIGANPAAVLPCTTTPARLQVMYSNGALVTGEYKSGNTRRNYPVEHVFVEFAEEPYVLPEIIDSIKEADIIVLAPGSLFSSIIPILQVPGLADEIRNNTQALKILVSNLWVQKGETDVVRDDPTRRFYVSDLISAYHSNIPGGVYGLFQHILTLGLYDIPGSILQNYALEQKVPIYLDRAKVQEMGFSPIEARIFSQTTLQERRIVQHDPDALARAIRTLWAIRGHIADVPHKTSNGNLPECLIIKQHIIKSDRALPNQRYAAIVAHTENLVIVPDTYKKEIKALLTDILWRHSDILINHLAFIKGLSLLEQNEWRRSQQWDNIFSFYDPIDGMIKMRQEVFRTASRFEVAFLVALGESLLGNYAASKQVLPIEQENEILGKVYRLTLRPPKKRHTFFNKPELELYLRLTRMNRSKNNELLFTRLINGNEGFTPPGLLFGLIYAWYLDNRLDAHIEYKMAIMRNEVSDLIPEQAKMFSRRRALIDFFRVVVFRHNSITYENNM